MLKYYAAFIGLVAANFLYQAFAGHDWHIAFDRSFFQTVALAIAALIELKLS